MLEFTYFKTVIHGQFKKLAEHELFRTGVAKEDLWNTYLNSFPVGTNSILRERSEHDCQACKQFIRAVGNTVAIVDGDLVSIWDVEIGGRYQSVVDALSKLVKTHDIVDVFLHNEKKVGTDVSRQMVKDGPVKEWYHLYFELPDRFVRSGAEIGTLLSNLRSNKEVFKRGLMEIDLEAVETVLELIDQNSLYRGEEHKAIVELFKEHKILFDDVVHETKEDLYCWKVSMVLGNASKIRNTVIGTLLTDISEGKDLDYAVKAFENKVAPSNYKRPTALITKGMIDKAQKKVEELGIGDSLKRRYAKTDDISINNVVYADRAVKKAMNVFDELAENVPDKTGNLSKVDEVDIETFINTILPKSDSIELLFENKHSGNLMSLIAPEILGSKRIFKWDNNFSWSYNGEVTDSIKERVKQAGGSVTGDLRCSLSWFNYDDLDIWLTEPDGIRIGYSSPKSARTGGRLDVDMNAGGGKSRNAVENITHADKSRMKEGTYKLHINNFCRRETIDVGFDVEIEFGGVIHTFHHEKAVKDQDNVTVATFSYSHKDGIKILKSLPSTLASKEVWSISTEKYQKVSMIMHSPNHWDGHKTGNKHWFFILDDCKNDKQARGFYNEFLNNDLTEHRKVFEVLGVKMKTEKSDNQLSGLGFSSTQRNHVFCKVSGSFSRTIKINF